MDGYISAWGKWSGIKYILNVGGQVDEWEWRDGFDQAWNGAIEDWAGRIDPGSIWRPEINEMM